MQVTTLMHAEGEEGIVSSICPVHCTVCNTVKHTPRSSVFLGCCLGLGLRGTELHLARRGRLKRDEGKDKAEKFQGSMNNKTRATTLLLHCKALVE